MKSDEKTNFDLVNKILDILEANYKGRCDIPFQEQHDMLKDLDSLMAELSLNEKNYKELGKIAIKRVIPLLDLIVKLDTNGNCSARRINYNKFLKNAYKISARISLEHYMIYREWDEPQKEKFFEPRYNIMAGYIYYLEKIETDDNFTTLIANMPSGYGKLIANDVPVLTKDGWKKHGDLKVGDYVLSPKGEFIRVNIVHPKRYANTKVTFEDGEEIYCHNQHEWQVYDRNAQKEKQVETNYLLENQHEKDGRNRFYLPLIEMVKGEEKKLPVDPYTYGVWLGDGSTKQIGDFIHDSYLTASISQRLELLSGIIDANGYLDKKKQRYTITACSKKLKDDIVSLIYTFGWRASVTTVPPTTSTSGITGNKSTYYIGFNPTIYVPCKLERKQLSKVHKQKRIGIKKVEFCELKVGNCITVDGGLYLVGRTLKVTHNTYPEKISEAWSFGVDPTGTILSLCSNDDVVKGGSRTVIDEIKSDHFGEVFPKMKWSKEDKNYFLKETDGNWKLKDCKMLASYYASTTQANVVGERASKRIHIDDLYPDYKEAMKQDLNLYYYNKFLTVWKKRYIQNKTPKIVITGTLWASGDFIALVIRYYKKKYKFHKHPKFPYTWVSEDGKVAIIQVPALDYKTNESVCPELKTTEELLEEKASMEDYLWQTNFQQIPTDPESLFFGYSKLRVYDKIPPTDFTGAYAVIDATRKSGKDNFAMPIFSKVQNGAVYDYYLKDCIFTKTATKDMYDIIVEKIIEHNIVKLVIESNVTSELSKAISKKLKSYGYVKCEIIEKYNTVPKTIRIENEKGNIKKLMVFPKKETYGVNTEMYKFMENLTLYNNAGSNPTDDAPDSLAMFSSEIIEDKAVYQKAQPILGIREYF